MAEEDRDYITNDEDIRAAVRLHLNSEPWQKRLESLDRLTPGELRAHQDGLAYSLLITVEPDNFLTERDIMYAEARDALEDADFTGDSKVISRTVDILLQTLQGYVDRRVQEVFQPEALATAKVVGVNPTPEIAAAALEQFDPEPDAPLSLAQAVCLPELGGILFRNTESEPSATITEKTLRRAIERGQLAVTRFNSKNIYVTRRQIQEWIASCQDQQNPRISFGSSQNISPVQRKSSSHGDTGQSSMDRSLLARDSALNFVRKLK